MKITHDDTNDRVKGFECEDPVLCLKQLEEILHNYQYSKAIAYLTPRQYREISHTSWKHEATISGFYSGQDAMLVTFYTAGRNKLTAKETALIEDVIRVAHNKSLSDLPALQQPFLQRAARNEDCPFLADLFKEVFPNYADHDVYNPSMLQQRIQTKSHLYHVIEDTTTEQIAAVACIDLTEPQYQSCEIGDCVVLTKYQGKALMQYLFISLENEARLHGFKYFFTMTRATSYPMNLCARSSGYKMTGTMINNCHMVHPIQFESMNIWCKDPQQSKI